MTTIQAPFQPLVGVVEKGSRRASPIPATPRAAHFPLLRALLAKWRWEAERPDRRIPYY